MVGAIFGGRKPLAVKPRNKTRKNDNLSAPDRRRQNGQFDNPWRPEDDYLLINSVFVTCNLTEVYKCVQFSKVFTEAEVEARWRSLLFNSLVSSTSREAIASLSAIVRSQLDARIPFSGEEDNLLVNVSYNEVFHMERDKYTVFENLLHEHPNTFYHSRTPRDLYSQWNRFRGCHLIHEDTNTIPSLTSPASSSTSLLPLLTNQSASKSVALLGGQPNNFEDTEFLLQETTARDLQAGLSHLMESSTIARRRRLLGLSDTYHGFQALVSQAVADTLKQREAHLQQTSTKVSFYRPNAAYPSKSPICGTSRLTKNADLSDSSASETNYDETSMQRQRERHRLRRRLHAKLRRVGEEARRWTALLESKVAQGTIICDHQPVFPNLATLTGTHSRFLIKAECVTFGRAVANFSPDIDLSMEGEAARVSRRHGKICLIDSGSFWLTNFSKHIVYVDGNPVLKGKECRLRNMSIICIAHLTLRFDVEHEHLAILSSLSNSSKAFVSSSLNDERQINQWNDDTMPSTTTSTHC